MESNKDKVSESFIKLQEFRKTLPIYAEKDNLIKYIKSNRVSVIVAETGSGKTTQIPQYLLESGEIDRSSMVITQPRRVAAISVAGRVAEEVGTTVGDVVGYSVRFDEKVSKNTKIAYMTDGMLLRNAIVDPQLKRYRYIVIDEAHERTVSTDLLLGLIKNLLEVRHNLRVIIMSATMETSTFTSFFGVKNYYGVPGRTFPVKEYFLPNPEPDYVAAAVETALTIHMKEVKETKKKRRAGDILVFLTGQDEIDSVHKILTARNEELMKRKAELKTKEGLTEDELLILKTPQIYPTRIYGALPQHKQVEVFEPIPEAYQDDSIPLSARKIVLSTNICESSVTISGIRHVIDSGVVKCRVFQPETSISSLVVKTASKASVKQRSGRAGREAPGTCYHLYTEDSFHSHFPFSTEPEILRSSIVSPVLTLIGLGVPKVTEFPWLNGPSIPAIQHAIKTLVHLGAVKQQRNEDGVIFVLSDLGKKYINFPLEPAETAAIFAGDRHGCAADVISILSCLNAGHFYVNDNNSKKRMDYVDASGDHVTMLKLYSKWKSLSKVEQKQFAKTYDLNNRTLQSALDVEKQLRDISKEQGIALSHSEDPEDILRALCAGFFMNVAVLDQARHYKIGGGLSTMVSPASQLHNSDAPYLIYNEVVETSKTYLRTVSAIEKSWLPSGTEKLIGK